VGFLRHCTPVFAQHEVCAAVSDGLLIACDNCIKIQLLIRPDEVLSRISNVAILEVAHHTLGVLLQHRHVVVGRFA
jgi:hypothetical protein